MKAFEENRAMTPPADVPDISTENYETILRTLKKLRDFNLDLYKDKCAKRRIAIRMRKTNCSSATEYSRLLMLDQAEPDHLIKVLTIHVSQFFRNPSTFQTLKEKIFPYLFSLSDRDTLKIWSAGCAGGEEPYTTALILKECFGDSISGRKVSILGTDIDSDVLQTAKNAIYAKERLADVPDEYMSRWFKAENDKFRLAPEITGMVTFGRSDLFDTRAFPKSDLIVCRNVLIYLERTHQERILSGFADALRNGGMLVLGKAETLVGQSRQRFHIICPVERIYQLI